MKKIRLDPEALEVTSFATAANDGARGTVRGASGASFHPEQCVSFWVRESCTCEDMLPTQSLARECLVIVPPGPTEDVTCATCPGIHPGC